ncbi:MAG TPA: hypothetical protein VFV26_08235, partial [Geothrix sp.]|nr:hypothetical protein [Geothrix sp.]
MKRPAGLALLLVSAALQGQHPATKPSAAQAENKSRRLTDAEAAELAKAALGAGDPAAMRVALARLKGHAFKSSKAPERELALYAQGMLEARLGNLSAAAVPLKKLEKQWPKSPFNGEVQTILAEEAAGQRRFKDAESRLHRALASDIPSERKRKAQELLLWTLVEQGRAQEGVAIVESLRPLEGNEKPSEQGLAAIVEILGAAGDRQQLEGSRNAFVNLYPASVLMARVDLAYGQVLGRTGDAAGSAQILRKLIQDHPASTQADDARLALASLLTDGSLTDTKDMPSAESLLAEVRRNGKALPMGQAQLVELRVLVGKSLWEDALNLADRMGTEGRRAMPEAGRLWGVAWNAWVGERLEKGFPGELLARLKPGAFGALEAKFRLGVAKLLASRGLLDVLPALFAEAPAAERGGLRKAALAEVQPEAQPQAVLKLLPAKGGTPDEALLRARAEAAQQRWPQLRATLRQARPGPERMQALLRLLQRPLAKAETASQRLKEAEGWLAQASEKGMVREPLAILVADLRIQAGDFRGALALYPVKAASAEQRGWVALMRAQALL